MIILLFGKNGQVGWELNRSLQPLGEVITLSRDDADFSNPESLREIVRDVGPEVIVNAAAYTSVDKAEKEEDLALLVNAESPKVLAEEALNVNALLVHYSTDYVFDGTKMGPYVETDVPSPINAYGRTKLKGEIEIQASGCDYLIFRTSWVYAARGSNFLLTILKLAEEREELRVVMDQVGAPTSAQVIADTTFQCLKQTLRYKKAGHFHPDLYHLACSGFTSWHGFAERIVNIARKQSGQKLILKNNKAVISAEYPTLAKRPLNSRLESKKLEQAFGIHIISWEKALDQCMESYK